MTWYNLNNLFYNEILRLKKKTLYGRVEDLDSKYKGFYYEKLRLCLVTVFVFYFQNLVFENKKKKQFSCIDRKSVV